MARKRKGLLSCLLSLFPRDPYQKCVREGGRGGMFIFSIMVGLFSHLSMDVFGTLVYLEEKY